MTFKNRGHLGSRYTYMRIYSCANQPVGGSSSIGTHLPLERQNATFCHRATKAGAKMELLVKVILKNHLAVGKFATPNQRIPSRELTYPPYGRGK